jgi:preprotein translocase subunit SecA
MAAAGAASPEGYVDAAVEAEAGLPVVEQRRVDETQQIGRNDPCWCGSGKKFKKCHGS